MNRRQMISRSALGASGLAIVTAFGKCNPASIGVEVSTVITFLNKISSLLPGQAAFITKIVAVANDFNKAYQAGKFADALSIFTNLSGLVDQLVADIGVNVGPTIKIALAIADAAVSAIAVLLHSQAGAPGVEAAKSKASGAQKAQGSVVEKRAAKAEKLFAAIH